MIFDLFFIQKPFCHKSNYFSHKIFYHIKLLKVHSHLQQIITQVIVNYIQFYVVDIIIYVHFKQGTFCNFFFAKRENRAIYEKNTLF